MSISFEFRARIGVGVSLGVALGAVLAEIFFWNIQAKIIGIYSGGALGGVVGSRLKSQPFNTCGLSYLVKLRESC